MSTLWEQGAAKLKQAAQRGGLESNAIRRAADAVSASNEQAGQEAQLRAGVQRFYDTGLKALQLAAQGGFPQYARDYVKIRDKAGSLRPLVLNRAQIYVHEMAERQLTTRGYVRIIVLKGRQMGMSTYIVARGYFKASRQTGQKAYILTHELSATQNLFKKVKEIHDLMDPRLRPTAGRSNNKELTFPGLGSEYSVGTAKVGDTGRSLTVQFFHGSECAFWQAAKAITAGLMQALGAIEGTESWMESTANGVGNSFHAFVQEARKSAIDYELAFCPWFWDSGYATADHLIPAGFADSLNLEDREYMNAHGDDGLTMGQMHWRSKKIAEFAASEGGSAEAGRIKFCQEYPATVEEAFQSDNELSFIRAVKVVLARKAMREYQLANNGARPQGFGPKRMGIDPSRTGGDGFRLWMRQGRVAWRSDHWSRLRTLESVSRILAALEKEQPDEIYIDIGNNGGPIFDILAANEQWGDRMIPVDFGGEADDPDRHQNKRCEMWSRGRDWLNEKPQPYLDDIDEIQADLTAVHTRRDEVGNRTKLESKDDLVKRLGPHSSPDDGDSFNLTFAYPSGGPASGRKSRQLNPKRRVFYGSGMQARG